MGRIGRYRLGTKVSGNPHSIGLFSSGQDTPGPPYETEAAGANKSDFIRLFASRDVLSLLFLTLV